MKEDFQHQGKIIQDWDARLKHLQSMLIALDADCALREDQPDRTFYNGLWRLIKLWINEKGQHQMFRDNLVSSANRVEAKTRI